MNVTITGRHMETTEAIKDYIQNALEKVKEHFDKVIDVKVILSVEKRRHIAEINLHANGLRINAKDASSDLYTSVDSAISKIDKQICKFKDRIMSHKPRRSKDSLDYDHQIIEVLGAAINENGHEEEGLKHRVIKREQVPVKPMSVDEAALQLELLHEPFVVFSNAKTEQINVLYDCGDGTLGLIEPRF